MCRGNFFSDSSKHQGRAQNIELMQQLRRRYKILIRDCPVAEGVVVASVDLNFSKAGDPDINAVDPAGLADAASNHVKAELGYTEVIKGGKAILCLDRRKVAECCQDNFEEPLGDPTPSFIFGPCNFLVQSDYYKVSNKNSKVVLLDLIRRLEKEIIPGLSRGLEREFNIRFNLHIASTNHTSSGGGGGGSATVSDVSDQQERDKEDFELVMKSTITSFQAFRQHLVNIYTSHKPEAMPSDKFKAEVRSASSLLANSLDANYTNLATSRLKSKEEWVFSKCVTSALDDVINFLIDTEKFLKPKEVVEEKFLKLEVAAGRIPKRGGAIQDTSVSLQSVEPNSSEVTTSPFITENELQPLSTKNPTPQPLTNAIDSDSDLTENKLGTENNDLTNDNKSTTDIVSSVTNPIDSGYGLTENNDVTNDNKSTTDIVSSPIENDNSPKPMVKIYKTINSRGDILFDVVIELFGDDIYGGYLGVSNGKSFLKIFTSQQEVNEYITENIPDLQEQNNLITDVPEKIPTEELANQSPEESPAKEVSENTPAEEVSGEASEKPPEEAKGILSYLGLGGRNKSRSNRSKSRKLRKTIRQNKNSNKGTKKHKKIIKHKKSRSNI